MWVGAIMFINVLKKNFFWSGALSPAFKNKVEKGGWFLIKESQTSSIPFP